MGLSKRIHGSHHRFCSCYPRAISAQLSGVCDGKTRKESVILVIRSTDLGTSIVKLGKCLWIKRTQSRNILLYGRWFGTIVTSSVLNGSRSFVQKNKIEKIEKISEPAPIPGPNVVLIPVIK